MRRAPIAVLLLVVAVLSVGCATMSLMETIESLLAQAKALLDAKRFDEALTKLVEVIRRDPTQWKAYLYSAQAYIGKLYKNVPVLDTGARGSTTTFAQRGIGDVFISWENEAYLATEELGPGKFEIIYPSLSILAEPPVAVVDKVALRRGTADVARAYLEYLYSKEAQEIIARHHYRPRDSEIAAKYAKDFPKIEMVTIKDFGGWAKAQKEHFGDGGIFDKIYTN